VEQHRLWVFKNWVLRKKVEPKRDDIAENCIVRRFRICAPQKGLFG
jgi:hypothetical protein